MAVEFTPDPAGLTRYLCGRDVREMLAERAKVGQQRARAAAPRRSGTYATRIEVYDAGTDLRDGGRAELHLVANVDYAAALEWGTANPRRQGGYTAALHVVRSTIDAIERGT